MALVRGFTQVERTKDSEIAGKVSIPGHILRLAKFLPGSPIEFEVIRVKGTSRLPHVFLHRPDCPPFVSPQEAVFLGGVTVMNDQGQLLLTEELLEEAKLKPTDIVEVKVAGARGAHWLVFHNRGAYHFLGRGGFPGSGVLAQKKKKTDGVRGKEQELSEARHKEKQEKEWQRMLLDY